MPCGTAKFCLFDAGSVRLNRCTNKNVGGMKLIQFLLGEGITANLFAPSACGLIQNLADSFESADSGLRNTGLDHLLLKRQAA